MRVAPRISLSNGVIDQEGRKKEWVKGTGFFKIFNFFYFCSLAAKNSRNSISSL